MADADTALARRMALARAILETSTRLQTRLAGIAATPASFPVPDPNVLNDAGRILADAYRADTEATNRLRVDLIRSLGDALQSALDRALTRAPPPPLPDRRFRHESWDRSPPHRLLAELYLAASEQVLASATSLAIDDVAARRKALFWLRQAIATASPANGFWTNPQAQEAARASEGESALRGAQRLLTDLADQPWPPFPATTRPGHFQVGRDLATTPGKIVHRNDLMELIQYAATTEHAFRRPLLIVPPWINKYYVLDITERASFVRWAVSEGHTVFVVSWANPGKEHAETGFDDYLRLGLLEALEVVRAATGEARVNALGYCLGGTLLACGLAWLAHERRRPIAAATFLTCLLDFAEPGDLGVFIDEAQLERLERHIDAQGFLEAGAMKRVFALLRPVEMIWNYVVSGYLLGEEPAPFDLLHWNADGTNMPRRMHRFYLRELYLENRLARPGGIELLGRRLDLGRVRTPAYFLSTREDHIAPWPSTFAGAGLLGGETTFVLAGSGHIAGVVNPAGSPRYGYRTGGPPKGDPAAWDASTTAHPGSWWPHWSAWLARHAGGTVKARRPGERGGPLLGDAPGRYATTPGTA